MHVSLSELETTLVKAVTGLGLPLGTGEEAGRAARQAALDGWDAVPGLVAALERLDRGASGPFDPDSAAKGLFRPADGPLAVSALLAAPAACDLLLTSETTVILEAVDCPDVILAQLRGRLLSSPLMERVRLARGDGEGENLSGLCGAAGPNEQRDALARLLDAGSSTLTLSIAGNASPQPSTRGPGPALQEGVELDDDLWRRLYRLYARTLVEASEASRLSGAGAGLTDND